MFKKSALAFMVACILGCTGMLTENNPDNNSSDPSGFRCILNSKNDEHVNLFAPGITTDQFVEDMRVIHSPFNCELSARPDGKLFCEADGYNFYIKDGEFLVVTLKMDRDQLCLAFTELYDES